MSASEGLLGKKERSPNLNKLSVLSMSVVLNQPPVNVKSFPWEEFAATQSEQIRTSPTIGGATAQSNPSFGSSCRPPYMLSDPNAKIEPAEGGATNYPPSVESFQLIPLVLVCKPPITFLGSKKKIQDLQTVGSQLCAAFPVCWLSFILL